MVSISDDQNAHFKCNELYPVNKFEWLLKKQNKKLIVTIDEVNKFGVNLAFNVIFYCYRGKICQIFHFIY